VGKFTRREAGCCRRKRLPRLRGLGLDQQANKCPDPVRSSVVYLYNFFVITKYRHAGIKIVKDDTPHASLGYYQVDPEFQDP